jgi:hypothetical protein
MTSNLNHELESTCHYALRLSPLHTPIQHTAILDSGATGHFLRTDSPCCNRQPTQCPLTVRLPDGSTMQSTHTATLHLPGLPITARTAHLFPTLHAGALLSVALLCDHGCTVTFTSAGATVTHHNQTLLTGPRHHPTGLWHVNLVAPPDPPRGHALSALPANTKADLSRFLHAACFSPAPSTWCKAIQAGHFTTWPGLSSALVTRHLPPSLATLKGHQQQTRKNAQSTKASLPDPPDPDHSQRTHCLFMAAAPITGLIFSDQTGRFPVTSSRGHNYLMIGYDHDSNAILAEPMKNRSAAELVRAYQQIHDTLTSRGLRPQAQRLDNEAPGPLQQFLRDAHVDFQLAPPHVHRRNAAERAIQTFKNHFVAGLSSTDEQFPLHLWDRLLPQALLTLNLLRTSRINPQLSAHAQLFGAFDFNRTPLAPPGTRVLIHEKPAVRASWAPHGVPGWYLGPATNHYRCYRVYVSATHAERISDTVEFLPVHVPMPQTSSADRATYAALDLIQALQHPAPAAPFLNFGDAQLAALHTLSHIFRSAIKTPVPEATYTHPAVLPRVGPPAVPPPAATPVPALPHPTHRSGLPPPTRHLILDDGDDMPDPLPPVPGSPPLPPLPEPRYLLRSHRALAQANAVTDELTGAQLEYRHLVQGPDRLAWEASFANELGRLAQGNLPHHPGGSDTIFFIPRARLPAKRRPTYGRIVVELRPQKSEVFRTRLTVGGNLIQYPGNVSTPTADLSTTKCLINSTISTPGARFLTCDIKNFYLNTPMTQWEYMKLPLAQIPATIIAQYQLAELADNGWVYIEIRKGMYGLPQAGILAHTQLVRHLATHGYHPTTHTAGLWSHHTRPIAFTLVVDDFGIRYVGREHADHLLQALQQHYQITTDWTGSRYCGLTLAWDYQARTVDLSMPEYVAQALKRFQHPTPARPEHSPHRWQRPAYGQSVQLAPEPDRSPP